MVGRKQRGFKHQLLLRQDKPTPVTWEENFVLLLKPCARRSLKKRNQWYFRELPETHMLTHISLSFAGIELSLSDSEEPKTGRRPSTKLRESEPRAGILSCALVSAETSDGAKHRGSKGN